MGVGDLIHNVCTALFHEWTKSDDSTLRDLSTRILERRRLTSVIIPRKKYTKLGAVNLGKIPAAVETAGFDKRYYYIEDNAEKSAYDVYNPEELDDAGFSPTTHIMTPNEDGRLQEISSKSTVIQTLSDNEVKQIRVFFPEEITPDVNQIVNNHYK